MGEDMEFLRGMVDTWKSEFFGNFLDRTADALPKHAMDALQFCKRQYASAICPLFQETIKAAIAEEPDYIKPIQAPIFAICASGEVPNAETQEKMMRWKELTTGDFELKVVPGDHFTCLTKTPSSPKTCEQMHKLVVNDMSHLIA